MPTNTSSRFLEAFHLTSFNSWIVHSPLRNWAVNVSDNVSELWSAPQFETSAIVIENLKTEKATSSIPKSEKKSNEHRIRVQRGHIPPCKLKLRVWWNAIEAGPVKITKARHAQIQWSRRTWLLNYTIERSFTQTMKREAWKMLKAHSTFKAHPNGIKNRERQIDRGTNQSKKSNRGSTYVHLSLSSSWEISDVQSEQNKLESQKHVTLKSITRFTFNFDL